METPLKLDPRTYDRALACVHCGLCLPACPTYVETGNEAESPRGRIQLIRALSDGAIEPTASVRGHLDLCLDCRACETACPSGVVYHELIEEMRSRLAKTQPMPLRQRLLRWMFFHILTHPRRLTLALLPGRLFKRLGLFKTLTQMVPDSPIRSGPLPQRLGAGGKPRVGYFAGCVGSVLFQEVNRQAMELLAATGAEVVAPVLQGCCGAIHHHNGEVPPAMEMARRNIDAFGDVDFVVSSIAGCGAMLREYAHLLRDDPGYAAKAEAFSNRARDICELLAELELPAPRHAVTTRACYHDACHLAHAQKVTAAPRQLLARIPGLELVPLPESDMCCGAAGTYNLTQPAMAAALGKRKLANIESTGAAVCITGNAGCALQIQAQARQAGLKLEVKHPVELLHAALFGGVNTPREPVPVGGAAGR